MAHSKGISRGEVILQILTKYRAKPYNETDSDLIGLITKRIQSEWNNRKSRIYDEVLKLESWKSFKTELESELKKEHFTENEMRQIIHNIQK